jgi:hypothetical protein
MTAGYVGKTLHYSIEENAYIPGDSIRQSDPIGIRVVDRPLKLAPGASLLKLLISSRGRSKPTDRLRRIPTPGSHQIPTLGTRMSVHNPESDRILSAGWILPDSLSDSLTWVITGQDRLQVVKVSFFAVTDRKCHSSSEEIKIEYPTHFFRFTEATEKLSFCTFPARDRDASRYVDRWMEIFLLSNKKNQSSTSFRSVGLHF